MQLCRYDYYRNYINKTTARISAAFSIANNTDSETNIPANILMLL